jgi:hypothetical protein
MKIIEALKAIKHLDRKIEKALERISTWCSYELDETNPEPPLYNADDISKMRQQVIDWTLEKARLRHLLHKTNIKTSVEFDGKTYNIDQLLLLKTVVIPARIDMLKRLTRRNPSHRSFIKDSDKKVKIVMQYDPKEREKEVDSLDNISMKISALLDNLTLTTEVVE